MNPFKSFRSSYQLNHAEYHFQRKRIFYIILFDLVLGLLIFTLIRHSHTDPKRLLHLDPLSSLNPETGTIQHVCNVTSHYPGSSQSNTKSLLVLSLHCSLLELSRIKSLPEELTHQVNDTRTQTALRDCGVLFEEALNMVNQTIDAVVRQGMVRDVNVWISGLMSDIETCLDGLDEMGSDKQISEEIRQEVTGLETWMSISLAIVADSLSKEVHGADLWQAIRKLFCVTLK